MIDELDIDTLVDTTLEKFAQSGAERAMMLTALLAAGGYGVHALARRAGTAAGTPATTAAAPTAPVVSPEILGRMIPESMAAGTEGPTGVSSFVRVPSAIMSYLGFTRPGQRALGGLGGLAGRALERTSRGISERLPGKSRLFRRIAAGGPKVTAAQSKVLDEAIDALASRVAGGQEGTARTMGAALRRQLPEAVSGGLPAPRGFGELAERGLARIATGTGKHRLFRRIAESRLPKGLDKVIDALTRLIAKGGQSGIARTVDTTLRRKLPAAVSGRRPVISSIEDLLTGVQGPAGRRSFVMGQPLLDPGLSSITGSQAARQLMEQTIRGARAPRTRLPLGTIGRGAARLSPLALALYALMPTLTGAYKKE